MFKITYGKLRSPVFLQSLSSLYTYDGYNRVSDAYNVKKIVDKINEEVELSNKLYLDMLKKYAELTPEGDLVHPADQPNQYIIPEDKSIEFQDAVKDFEQHTIEMNIEPIPLKIIDSMKLSPAGIGALEGIIKYV